MNNELQVISMDNPLNPNAPIIYLKETDSTMLEARRRTESEPGLASGTVIQAEYQSAGRGRMKNRRWEASPGDSLLFTVIFTKPDLSRCMSGRPFTLLPLLCGLAVAGAVTAYAGAVEACASGGTVSAADIRIKWPNDVLAGGRKLCGILCEASGDYVYAGIGINLNQTEFAPELRRPACSVRMLTERGEGFSADLSAGSLFELVLEHLAGALSNDGWKKAVRNRLYKIGEVVQFREGLPEDASGGAGGLIQGVLSGIDEHGALILRTPDGTAGFTNGELLV
ncbi:MAG: biotin--[acetyl-CoA-carboxylase] ligase [Spirochaetales bacterium]|uniref:Biotin--[acetyl-CoA-carboxylase] ligase n=1 Tax=Candidatus Thalassospirochaeta sargassi TaxID=3119039 RepID=A0AAJ1IEY8_9SPIO|nr:biotin--[acetyl-CoA-carboxylase] ligase [Spirochaetales bacterium]